MKSVPKRDILEKRGGKRGRQRERKKRESHILRIGRRIDNVNTISTPKN